MENNEQESKYPELVAYLDGELDSTEKQAVEARLAADETYREELAQLQRTWDLLDALPSVRATESFTQSTVEMVALSAATDVYRSSPVARLRRFLLVLLLILLPLTAFGWGYWRTRTQLNADNLATLRDLEIIRRFPIYRSVNADVSPERSIRFLELLAEADQQDDLFISFDVNLSEKAETEIFETPLIPANLNIESLGTHQMETLAENKRSFDKLESQKDNLRRFHQLLTEHPRYHQLVTALARYHTWFRGRIFLSTQEEIDRIKDASPEERMDLIRNMEREHFRDSFKYIQRQSRIPAIQDYKKIRGFGREILAEIHDSFIQLLASSSIEDDPALAEVVEALKSAPTDHHFFSLMIRYSSELYGGEFVNPFFDPARIRPFIEELSDESKEILDGLDDRARIMVVQFWIFSTLGNLDNSELAQFENKVLSGIQRSSLNKLSNYQQKREILTKAFFYTLEPFRPAASERKLPDDLMELADWDPFFRRSRDRGKDDGNDGQ